MCVCVHVNSSHGQTKRKPRCTQTNSPAQPHTHLLLWVCVSVPGCCRKVCYRKFSVSCAQQLYIYCTLSLPRPSHPSRLRPEKARGWPERKIELFIWLRLSYLKLFYVPLSQRKLFLHQQRERVQELEKERETKRMVGGGGVRK